MGHPYTALHTFHLAVRFQSLKCTADYLHLTESAVSHQIKRLEAQLGYTLFYKYWQTRLIRLLTPLRFTAYLHSLNFGYFLAY
jgi:biotin operon repressor